MSSRPGAALCLLLAACTAPQAPPPAVVPGAFVPLAAPTRQSLRGLSVVDARVLWVGGSGGTLLRSVDGGGTWADVAPPDAAACDFRDLEAFDADTAVAMVAGLPARVYRTDDGGRRWRIVLADARPDAFFDGIGFAGGDGVLFADPIDGAFGLWTSADGGITWDPVPRALLPPPLPGEAAFAASGACVVARRGAAGPEGWVTTGGAVRSRLLRGDAAGWRTADTPLAAGAPSRGGFALAFAPAGGGVVLVGGDHAAPDRTEGTAAWSDDVGASWHAAAGGAGGYRSAAVWLDERTVLAVGSAGASWSADGGRSWRPLPGPGWHALARGRDGSVFACGADGRVARFVRATP